MKKTVLGVIAVFTVTVGGIIWFLTEYRSTRDVWSFRAGTETYYLTRCHQQKHCFEEVMVIREGERCNPVLIDVPKTEVGGDGMHRYVFTCERPNNDD